MPGSAKINKMEPAKRLILTSGVAAPVWAGSAANTHAAPMNSAPASSTHPLHRTAILAIVHPSCNALNTPGVSSMCTAYHGHSQAKRATFPIWKGKSLGENQEVRLEVILLCPKATNGSFVTWLPRKRTRHTNRGAF